MNGGKSSARLNAERRGFPYYLENGSAKEYVECPNPNCKSHFMNGSATRSATPYRWTRTGAIVKASEFARCRHERACGYDTRPDGYSAPTNEGEPLQPARQFQRKFWRWTPATLSGSELTNYAVSMFGADRWKWVRELYGLIELDGRVGYQYADLAQRVRLVKFVRHRVDAAGHLTKKGKDGRPLYFDTKKPDALIDWCLFGSHLIHPGCTVAIVESEDTALFMRAAFPHDDRVWCASSGSSLTRFREFMQSCQRSRFEFFPDCDMIEQWTDQSKYLAGHGIRCHVVRWMDAPGVADVLEHCPNPGKADPKDWLIQSRVGRKY